MSERFQIVQQMEELAGKIKRIEGGLETISKEDSEHIDNIRVQYIIPNERNYSGNGVKAMIRDVAFPVPDEEFASKIIRSIRQEYDESLKECYNLMEEYAEKLKNAPR